MNSRKRLAYAVSLAAVAVISVAAGAFITAGVSLASEPMGRSSSDSEDGDRVICALRESTHMKRGSETQPQDIGELARRIGWYMDGHANLNPEMQDTVIVRYGATRALLAELEQCRGHAPKGYLAALYVALGWIKDPATITELRRLGYVSRDSDLLRAWLSGWETRLYWLPRPWGIYLATRWLDEPARWSALFRELILICGPGENRAHLIRVASYYFHDADMVSFMERLGAVVELADAEKEIAKQYVTEHSRHGREFVPRDVPERMTPADVRAFLKGGPKPWEYADLLETVESWLDDGDLHADILQWTCEVYRPQFHDQLARIARGAQDTIPDCGWQHALAVELIGGAHVTWADYVRGMNARE